MIASRPYHTTLGTLAMLWDVTRHAYIADGLGDRIRRLRQERGWTQTDLAERAGCSRRAIVYYERDGKFPPAPVLAAMAGAFGLDINSFMAPEEPAKKAALDEPDLLTDSEDRRLWKKFRQLKTLPERDKQTVLRTLNALVDSSHRAS